MSSLIYLAVAARRVHMAALIPLWREARSIVVVLRIVLKNSLFL